MKIWTLLENTACRQDVEPEHGLSLYIETGDRKILFDAGQSDAFSRNAETMGIDLKKADTFVLSHGHYDHGGGLIKFMEINGHAKIYASRYAFGDFYNGTEKYIGLADCLKTDRRIVKTGVQEKLGEGITLYGCGSQTLAVPVESYGLNVKENGEFHPDSFLHEQYLLIEEKGRRVLFSGCSHRGILNIVNRFHPDVLIGGFHFKKLDAVKDREKLESAARRLMQEDTLYYTCHCTGTAQYEFLKTIMGDRLHYLACGSQLEI